MGRRGASGAEREQFLRWAERGELHHLKAKVEEVGLEAAKDVAATACDTNRMYATHLAAEHDRAEFLSYLVNYLGASLMMPTARGNTPLHIAARSNSVACVQVLLRAGNKNWAQCRLLWIALRKDRFNNPVCALNVLPKDMIRLLTVYIMRDGFDFNKMILATNDDHLIPLEYALKCGARQCVPLLITPATITQVGSVLGSPLHYAAAKGSPEACALLAKMRCCGINDRNDRGETPLYRACCSYPESAETVETLLKLGADPSLGAKNGKLPVDESDARKYHASSKAIREHLGKPTPAKAAKAAKGARK